jgi:hypothetical protein
MLGLSKPHMTITTTIILGLVSGLLASVVTSITIVIFRDIVLPKIKAMRYCGLKIEGRWCSAPAGLLQEITLEIEQFADSLIGTAILTSKDKSNIDHEFIRTFKVKGFIKDGFVVFTSTTANQNRLGAQTFLLRAVNDGRHLDGILTFYSPTGSEIISRQLNLAHESCNPKIENDIPF